MNTSYQAAMSELSGKFEFTPGDFVLSTRHPHHRTEIDSWDWDDTFTAEGNVLVLTLADEAGNGQSIG